LQQLGYPSDSPKSKTNEGMDEMLAVLQASGSNETAEHAIEHMEHPFQHVKRPQVRTIDRIVPNEDCSTHVLISEAEYHHCNGMDNTSVVWTLDEYDQYVPSGMFNREPAMYSLTSDSHPCTSEREPAEYSMASGGERTTIRPINHRPSATTACDMHICSYPDDIQVVGQELNWTHIVAEAVQVLRENPHTFDIAEAYNYVAMNATQDGGANDGMADMERQIWEEGSDIRADDDVPGLEEIPGDDDVPQALA
jgi:hypothetical protein